MTKYKVAEKASATEVTMIELICIQWLERAEFFGYKPGKRRDAAAIEFIAGAASALVALGSDWQNNFIMWATLVVAPRGHSEIERVALEAQSRVATKS